jgi:acetolactate synthase-1/2/3 large subunit
MSLRKSWFERLREVLRAPEMMMMKGGEAVVKTLVNSKVATVYGLPGAHVLDIYEALRNESRIRHFLAMHEVNAAFMADAQGRLTGHPGVCLLPAGPGATNAVTAIAQAYTEASPVVQITGHCGTSEKIQPLHGVDDWDFLLKIYSPITKWSVQIKRAEDIPLILSKAVKVASSGRPGPVHVQIPRDILRSSVKFQDHYAVASEIGYETDEATIKKIADNLMASDRPLIVVGRDVLREFCWDEVMRLAQILGAPVLTVWSATSAIPFDFPFYVGYDLGWTPYPLIKSLIRQADTILALGLDLGEDLRIFKEKNRQLIHVHGDVQMEKNEENKVSKPQIDVVASVEQTVKALVKLIPQGRSKARDVEKKVSMIKKRIEDDVSNSIKWGSKPIHPGEVSAQLRHILNDDAIVTLDVGDSSTWMHSCYRAKAANTVLVPGRYASMGFALPAAIAAKVAFPERQVVAVTGDGGFLMSYMDFPTAVKYGLAIKIVVMSNGHYGTIWHLQKRMFHGHTFATEIQVPDFAGYAQSFGAEGFNVDDPTELRKVLEEAVAIKGPVVVGVHTDHKFPSYRPDRLMRLIRRARSKLTG